MAEDIRGICKFKLSDSWQSVIASEGSTEEYFGINVTSSNVNESLMVPISVYIFFFNKTNKYKKTKVVIETRIPKIKTNSEARFLKAFSTGSITFCGSLPWNNFENNLSKN
jgi:uracil DNA glycosylase